MIRKKNEIEKLFQLIKTSNQKHQTKQNVWKRFGFNASKKKYYTKKIELKEIYTQR